MEVKKIKKTHLCANCDQQLAEVEIANNGSFKLFWACGTSDKEITLCRDCFNKLKKQINAIEF